jgi:hypothetical protein
LEHGILKSAYWTGSPKTTASELAKCKLDLVAIQGVRLDVDGSEPADVYTFYHVNGKANLHSGTGFLDNKGIVSTAMTVEFITDSMSYVIL